MFDIYFYTYVMGMFGYIPEVMPLCYSAGFIWTNTWNIFMIHGHSPKTIIHQLDREINILENELNIDKDMFLREVQHLMCCQTELYGRDKKILQLQYFIEIRETCHKILSLYSNADVVCEISQGGREETIPYVGDDGYVSEGEDI